MSIVSISDVCPLIQVFGSGRDGGISKAPYETSKHSRPYFNTFAALIIQMALKVSAAKHQRCRIHKCWFETHVLCSRVRDADVDRGILVRGVRGHSFNCC